MKQNNNNETGDARICPIHGRETSSADGMFDAPCSACETEGEQAEADARWDALPQQERDEINTRIARSKQELATRDEALANDLPF